MDASKRALLIQKLSNQPEPQLVAIADFGV